MFETTSKEFGQPIQFSGETGGNKMVSRFVNIKKKHRKKLEDATASDPDGRRFYCADDCAYIFDVRFLKAIVCAIDNVGAGKGCMVLFQGLRREKEASGTYGRPTLIATAYKKEIDGDNKMTLTHLKIPVDCFKPLEGLTEADYDGIEHPGDGSSEGAKIFFADQSQKVEAVEEKEDKDDEEWIPVVLKADGSGECIIKEIISEKELEGWI